MKRTGTRRAAFRDVGEAGDGDGRLGLRIALRLSLLHQRRGQLRGEGVFAGGIGEIGHPGELRNEEARAAGQERQDEEPGRRRQPDRPAMSPRRAPSLLSEIYGYLKPMSQRLVTRGKMVGRQRLELWTRGLKVRCSAN